MKQTFFKKVNIKGRVRVCIEALLLVGIKNKTIVDVGSSIGWLEKELAQYAPKKLIGVEPDPDAVAFAKKTVKKAAFFVGNAENIPVASSSADIVTMFDVIEHVPQDKEHIALTEAYRALKPHGKLVLSTPNNHLLMNLLDPAWYFGHRHYRVSSIKHQVSRIGFKIEKFEIRGGIWFSIYLIWHYFMKWILRKPYVVNKYLVQKDDEQFSKMDGIHTIFLVAKKK